MSLPALPSTTDIRSITERVNAIIKNLYNKVIPVGAAKTVLTSDGTTLAWSAVPTATAATTFLGSDQAMTVAGGFVNGPNTGSVGADGQMWLIMAVAAAADASGAANNWEIGIFNGTTYVANPPGTLPTNSTGDLTAVVIVALSAATTFTLRAKVQTGNGTLLTTGIASGIANKATSITAVRLA